MQDGRKYNCRLIKSNTENGIKSKSNNVVWNLSSWDLTNEEHSVLSYVLNHGLSTNIGCNNVLQSM